MDLFSGELEEVINILPCDGIAEYYGEILSLHEADYYFSCLASEVAWQRDKAIVIGQLIETQRQVAWYADHAYHYSYSGTTKQAIPWTQSLLALKTMVEEKTGETYNSCLLNLYQSGAEGMAWHSDGETDLKEKGAIASLTLGAQRQFSFKHKVSKQKRSITLKHGSLLVMRGTTQKNWLHRLPPTKKPVGTRINLTFRTIVTT